MAQLAISTWSVHRAMGSFYHDAPDEVRDNVAEARWGPETLPLLEFPAEVARRGYAAAQLCHFHFPSRDGSYLADLRAALDESGVALDALLIDDGDLTHPTDAAAHERWIGGWIDTAAALGADKARVIAGMQSPTPERLAASGRALRRLAKAHPEIRIVTENWMALLPAAAEVTAVMDETGDRVGLCIDLGNWTGPEKYGELAAVVGYAETCHAKCGFTADGPEQDDFTTCLELLTKGGYDGPLALIYDGPDADEWGGLEQEREIARSVLAAQPG